MELKEGLKIKALCDCPQYAVKAAEWFSGKWSVPKSAYEESMEQCVQNKDAVPQWYIILNEREEIIAGAGIIENDFHDRKDLAPNVCALFVEEKYRCQGIAGFLLEQARKDMGARGLEKLYLITDHTSFYERYGWKFLTMVQEEDGAAARLYEVTAL